MDSESLLVSFMAYDGITRVAQGIANSVEKLRSYLTSNFDMSKLFSVDPQVSASMDLAVAKLNGAMAVREAAAAASLKASEYEQVAAQAIETASTKQAMSAAEALGAAAVQAEAAAAQTEAAAAEEIAAAQLEIAALQQEAAATMMDVAAAALNVALLALLASLALVGGVIGVLLPALDKLATKTSDYSLNVERNSQFLNNNATLYQTVVQGAEALGSTTENVNFQLIRFNRNLADGAPTLKTAGTSLQALGLAGLPADQALLKLADDFQHMTNEEQKTAIATDLFSRNGKVMAQLLSLGSTGIQELTSELSKMGLVLNDGQLAVGGLAAIVHQRLNLEMQGLEMQVGVRLETAFMILWNVMSQVLTKGSGLIEGISNALSKVVIWVSAFIAAITGTSISMDMLTKSATPMLDKLGLMPKTQEAATQATQAGTSALQDQIQALNDQKTALQDQQQAFDQGISDQTQGLQDQKAAFDQQSSDAIQGLQDQKAAQDDLLDSQIALIDAQKQQLDLQKQQDAMNDKLSTDMGDLAATQAEIAAAPFTGAQLGTLMSKQSDEQKKLSQDQEEAHYQSQVNQLDATKNSLEAQKKAADDAFADKIKQYENDKKAYDSLTEEKIKKLEEEKKAYDAAIKKEEDAVDDQTKVLQRQLKQQTSNLNAEMQAQVDSAGSGTTAISQFFDQMTSDITKNFGSTSASAKGAFASIQSAVYDVERAINSAQQAIVTLGLIFDTVLLHLQGFFAVGKFILDLADVLGQIATGDLIGAFNSVKAIPGDMAQFQKNAVDLNNQMNKLQAAQNILQAQASMIGAPTGDIQPVGGVGNKIVAMAGGGVISEPIAGVGLETGTRFSFGENGDEIVTPASNVETGSNQGMQARMLAVLERMEDHLNTIASESPVPGSYAAQQRAG